MSNMLSRLASNDMFGVIDRSSPAEWFADKLACQGASAELLTLLV